MFELFCCIFHLKHRLIFFPMKNLSLAISNFLRYSCETIRGKGAVQKKVDALRDLRRLLSRSEIPPIEAALQAGAIPVLVQCLSFGSPDEQVWKF